MVVSAERGFFSAIAGTTGSRRNLGIAPNILTDRLSRLVARGIFHRRLLSAGARALRIFADRHGPRSLRTVCRDGWPWGDRWLAKGKPPLFFAPHQVAAHDFSGVRDLQRMPARPIIAGRHAISPELRSQGLWAAPGAEIDYVVLNQSPLQGFHQLEPHDLGLSQLRGISATMWGRFPPEIL